LADPRVQQEKLTTESDFAQTNESQPITDSMFTIEETTPTQNISSTSDSGNLSTDLSVLHSSTLYPSRYFETKKTTSEILALGSDPLVTSADGGSQRYLGSSQTEGGDTLSSTLSSLVSTGGSDVIEANISCESLGKFTGSYLLLLKLAACIINITLKAKPVLVVVLELIVI